MKQLQKCMMVSQTGLKGEVLYLLQDGYCHIDNVTLTARITGYVNVTSGDPDALKVAVAKHGPISIAIDASRKTFSFYSNGIYYDPECGKC
jgi:hypothetical protein